MTLERYDELSKMFREAGDLRYEIQRNESAIDKLEEFRIEVNEAEEYSMRHFYYKDSRYPKEIANRVFDILVEHHKAEIKNIIAQFEKL